VLQVHILHYNGEVNQCCNDFMQHTGSIFRYPEKDIIRSSRSFSKMIQYECYTIDRSPRHQRDTQLQLPYTCTSTHPSLLTLDAAKTIAHGIVAARLDYCNALLHGTSTNNPNRLNVTQYALARAVCQASQTAGTTKLHHQLHWLLVWQRISYKMT